MCKLQIWLELIQIFVNLNLYFEFNNRIVTPFSLMTCLRLVAILEGPEIIQGAYLVAIREGAYKALGHAHDACNGFTVSSDTLLLYCSTLACYCVALRPA